MNTMGIDLHAKRSRYVLVSQEGNILKKGTIQSSPEAFRRAFTDFNPSQVQVALEATGNWFWAADVPEELGLQVHLANPYKVRLIAESTIKTDTVDTTALAHLLRMGWLPESRITPRQVRLLRERLRHRITLVRISSGLKCRIHAILGKCGIMPPVLTDFFGKTGRAWLQKLDLPVEYRQNLDGYLQTLDFLKQEIQRVECWLKGRLSSNQDARLLIGIPDIGLFGAALILAVGSMGNLC